MSEMRVAGRSEVRLDIVDKVTGAARYASDAVVPGMAHAALVRSTVGHGVLRGVDTAVALAAPGVHCVVTMADFPDVDPFYGEWVRDQPFLARDRVRFIGEPVAGVVADTEEHAHAAAALVVPDIEPLPVLGSAVESLAAADLVIHPDRASEDPELPNVCYRSSFEYGDVDAALAEATYVHDATYTFPAVYHYAMEPHAVLATWSSDGLDVISGTQQPFKVRADLARIFNVPLGQVRVRAPYVGGAYGSKGQSKYEPVTAAMARAAGRPVRLVISIGDAFHTVSRHHATIRMRTGIGPDGGIVGRDTVITYDTGAYADKGPRVARKGAYRAAGPYRIPNIRSVGLSVYSNRVPAGAFRGFSTPQVVWAGESAIDEIARHLGVDPLGYRRQHLKRRGEPFLGDDSPLDADLAEGLGVTAEALGWGSSVPTGRGRGLAVGVKDGGGGAARSEAEVRLHPDGSVEVLAATSELGQGAKTVMGQIAAEVLGCQLADVQVRLSDTAVTPFDRGTNASRSTIGVGAAVERAAEGVRRQVCQAAEEVLGISEGLILDGSDIVVGEHRQPLMELVCASRKLPPEEIGAYSATGFSGNPTGSGPLGAAAAFYEVGYSAAEVEVDPETGQVRISRFVSAADVGFAINPAACEGQDEGATVMGIGHTLLEELEFVDGELVNGTLVDYRVPRTTDLPDDFRSILIQNRDGPGPFGSKGAGEGGLLAVAPAIANAIADATGVRIRELPLTPERVWRAIQPVEPQES
ncbi:MAG: xanthine dehydrogenase family protein molybdopterin-binding subunit [Acidimicrobiia bacterium]|nr:xanthine dehydrogenase family protein molybdopterin-binding subunit [Acidimicrobiia bacterium]